MQQKKNQKSEDHHQIAVDLIKSCDNQRALSHLLKAIKFNPKSFLIRHTLGIIYYSMDQYDKAILEFKKILKQKANLTEARVNLARVYIDKNQNSLALKELKKAEQDKTYTNYLKIVSQKALVYYNKGNYALAKRELEEALSLPSGENCFSYLYRGKTEFKLGDLKKSEEFLKKAISLCEKNKPLCKKPDYEWHLSLAELYIAKKETKKARYHLNLFLKKVKRGPKNKTAKELLKLIS